MGGRQTPAALWVGSPLLPSLMVVSTAMPWQTHLCLCSSVLLRLQMAGADSRGARESWQGWVKVWVVGAGV